MTSSNSAMSQSNEAMKCCVMTAPNVVIHNREDVPETRGRKPLVSAEDWTRIEDFILENGFAGRVAGYAEIIAYVCPEHKDISYNTAKRAFEDRGYSKCVACQKPFLTPQAIQQRREYCNLRCSWKLDDWRRVIWSGEVHFFLSPRRKLKVIRKRGERYHRDCIQQPSSAKQAVYKDSKRYHVWLAVGFNFKPDLYFYETSSRNGKMTQRTYLNTVLQGPVRRWIDEGRDFILEEDQDTGHGTSDNNACRAWKEANGLNYFFNASGSPDLSPVENVIRVLKQKMKATDYWDDAALFNGINHAWYNEVNQRTIDKYCDSMPKRMRELWQREGETTGFQL